jgi:hypothetical protein
VPTSTIGARSRLLGDIARPCLRTCEACRRLLAPLQLTSLARPHLRSPLQVALQRAGGVTDWRGRRRTAAPMARGKQLQPFVRPWRMEKKVCAGAEHGEYEQLVSTIVHPCKLYFALVPVGKKNGGTTGSRERDDGIAREQ